MICPKCQTSNAEDANFCLNCGARITLTCPRCSRRVLSYAQFCDGCGFSLGAHEHIDTSAAIGQPVFREGAVPMGQPQPETGVPLASTAAESEGVAAFQEDGGGTQQVAVKQEMSQAAVAASPLTQYIPAELMRKLESAQSKGDMEGERRVVTMLFCDVKGSTAAAETLDPEEWSEIINGAFEHMIQPVYTYEGTVARLMGDGILAFFGAPLAHEDDPQRAVLASLDIVSNITPYREQIRLEWGIDIDVRIGINTGLVVVGAVGSDLRMEYTALGDAINLAARMEQTATPGTVQIAHDTYKIVKPLFNFEELGGIEVKGKEEAVLAYRVLGRKESAGRVRGIEGLHAELVGREVELQTLQGVVSDLKQGVGRIVCVLGEAGLGKSRLIAEAHQIYDQLPGMESGWYETSSLSYESNQAYGLIQRLIRKVSGIGFDDAPRVIQKKLSTLAENLPEESRARASTLLETLFGLDTNNGGRKLEGDSFKRDLFATMYELWRARFSDHPSVLVFDDMHWSDAASIDLIKELLPLTAEIGLVFVCAMRGERRAPAWQIKMLADDEYHHRYTEVSLRPLSLSESDELVNRLLAVAEIPDALRESVLEKSDGNPFFIEEVVRTLIETNIVTHEDRQVDGQTIGYWTAKSDGSDFSIPDNLQSLLASRMDRLEEATRATLQLASVIGRNFYLRVLQAVDEDSPELDKHVATLMRLDMIRESARVPEVEYAFRNPMAQEAVYKTILLKRRREFHSRVGSALEELYPNRLEGLYGLLAHHFTLAGEREKAIRYCRQAAGQAVAVYAYDVAEQNLRTALNLIDAKEDAEIHMAILEELADVCRLVRDFTEAIGYYQQALGIWESVEDGDNIIAIRLHRKIVEIATETKWSVDAETYEQVSAISQNSQANLQESLLSMEGEPPHEETVHLLVAMSTDAWRVQEPPDWEAAQKFAESSVAMAKQLNDMVLISQALGVLANVLDGRSKLRDHLAVAQQRLDISQDDEFEDAHEKVDTLRGYGAALMYVGEYEEALPFLDEAAELATNIQAMDQITNALGIRAQCLFRLDRWDDVLANEEKWRDLERRYSRERIGETCFFVALSASIFALRGDASRSDAYAKESFDYMVSMSGLPDDWQRNQFY
ncbi:MAG TPA: adenylate/guanylate cyclase domain-containing protein [candidate division Zixibacteria bacterium]|nr:adenylate/guanylate cyclase domain-containing protein [candidate division Zixibacteria bacterium]